ncbi:pantothenate kinase, type III [Bernardetia litoralis DSM 6794]|uniref:Type III pantothenate kinase n=1 Tax=Bernardetia litoralis (strain ATCC 23117 / DSM 6794 / NBRC 15988 / NCIMB 1366 / Fx l1 / Sio-4) TaxID=880071 RepID=I4AJD8_BERLS|nr:type III pantothenate kinase [Bernardetia litoralis]AFM04073.1 pantothenate kinase, type III [Bernardetia litoralis DSM 6794]
MLLLAVDFGNTTLKAALFENEKLLEVRYSLSIIDLEDWINQIKNNFSKNLEGIIISSVRKNEEIEHSFIENLKKKIKLIIKLNSDSKKIATDSKVISVVVLDENTPLPIQNNYKTPKTLGKDRLAAVIGAYFLEKETTKQPTLVIDAGTCITFDFIDTKESKGIYEGGSISLGLNMRFKALNHFTAKLPLFESNENLPNPMGKSTQEAMQSGVQFGLMSEIKGIIDFYQNQIKSTDNKELDSKLNIVVCGGDALILKKWWEEYVINFTNTTHNYTKWIIEPNLVLIGLQRIFQFIKNNEDN